MKHLYVIMALCSPLSLFSIPQSVSTQKEYIDCATKEWSQTYLPSLDAYQLQLLTSNLKLLYAQAFYTQKVDLAQQHLIYATAETAATQNIQFIETIKADCDALKVYSTGLETIDSVLQQCTEYLDSLDSACSQAIYEALDEVAHIGRKALTYHDDALSDHSQKLSRNLTQILNELSTYIQAVQQSPLYVEELGKEQPEYKKLMLFYLLNKTTSEITEKAWEIIGLNMLNTLKHAELTHTSATVFELCFNQAYAYMMQQEAPAEYKTLLFTNLE